VVSSMHCARRTRNFWLCGGELLGFCIFSPFVPRDGRPECGRWCKAEGCVIAWEGTGGANHEHNRADHRRAGLYFALFFVRGTEPAELQRHRGRGGGSGVPERGLRHLGVRLHRGGYLLSVPGSAVLQLDRRSLAFAYGLGCAASSVREPHRAVCRGLVVRVRHLRPRHRALVFRGCAVRLRCAPRKEAHGTRPGVLTDPCYAVFPGSWLQAPGGVSMPSAGTVGGGLRGFEARNGGTLGGGSRGGGARLPRPGG